MNYGAIALPPNLGSVHKELLLSQQLAEYCKRTKIRRVPCLRNILWRKVVINSLKSFLHARASSDCHDMTGMATEGETLAGTSCENEKYRLNQSAPKLGRKTRKVRL